MTSSAGAGQGVTSGTVLVGFDGGQSGRDAIAFAMRFCRSTGYSVVVASVYPTDMPTALVRSYGSYDRDWNAYEVDEARMLLDEAARSVAPDVPSTYESVASTSSSKGLADLAERTGADLVVLGSRRHGQERHTIPGSTGHRILTGSPCPVAIVPRRYGETGPSKPIKVVTVAFIGTTDAKAALDWAADLAERTKAELRLVTVIDRPTHRYLRKAEETADDFAAKAAENSLKAAENALGSLTQSVRGSAHVVAGPVVDNLATLGLENPELATDVLVLGSRGYGPVRRTLLGGVSFNVVKFTRVPIIVVPRGSHPQS